MKKILFLNKKGGVGKTTVCFQMGVYFATIGKKVLFVDCDSQGNLSGIFRKKGQSGVYELISGSNPQPHLCRDNLFILPGDIRLSSLEEKLFENEEYTVLNHALSHDMYRNFDFCFLDTGPSLGALTLNALLASDELVIVVTPQVFTLDGTSDCVKTIVEVWSKLGGKSRLSAVILNRYDWRPVIYRTVKQELENHFFDTMLKNTLSRSVKYEESAETGFGLAEAQEESKQKKETVRLGKELLSRING